MTTNRTDVRKREPRARGLTKGPEYTAWRNIKARCLRPQHPAWPNYGGRGITVCPAWAASFERFLADMGPRPSDDHSIDRIDNDRGYEPGNCRWATTSEQRCNQRPYRWRADQ